MIPPAFSRMLPLIVWLIPLTFASGQVPHILNYQGRIVSGGVNFDGTGQFKFALVGAGDHTNETYWSHDGASTGGAAPTSSLALAVVKGLYSVQLGDTSIEGMSAIPSSVFTHADVHLRVWFDDGVHGSQVLTPDQRIAAVGYAIIADTVTDGAITSSKLASGAVTSSHLASGAVGTAQLATGAVTADRLATGAVGTDQLAAGAVTATSLAPNAALTNLTASGQTGVTSGGVVLSPIKDNPTLLAAGYTALPFEMPTDKWEILPNPDSEYEVNRSYHTSVWTGSEAIMWGGRNGPYFNTGGRFNPITRAWTPTTTSSAPTARIEHTAVWTGSLMLVWGGESSDNGSPRLNTGGIYNPALNAWGNITTTNAPTSRIRHTAVWTGTEMIIWGGRIQGGTKTNTGARYNPSTDTWTPVSTLFAPDARDSHFAVWTGTDMIIWGGDVDGNKASGGRYNPVTNTWLPMNQNGPSNTYRYEGQDAFWTGSEMVIISPGSGRYNPSTDSWATISSSNKPQNTYGMSLVWTDSEIILWGPLDGNSSVEQGARYDLASDLWRPTTRTGAPLSRSFHTATWTGSQMVILGAGQPALYTPGKPMYLYQKP